MSMLLLRVRCASCGKGLKVRDELAGKKCRCPHCSHPLTVPRRAETALPGKAAAGSISCPECQAALKAPKDSTTPRRMRCPRCSSSFVCQFNKVMRHETDAPASEAPLTKPSRRTRLGKAAAAPVTLTPGPREPGTPAPKRGPANRGFASAAEPTKSPSPKPPPPAPITQPVPRRGADESEGGGRLKWTMIGGGVLIAGAAAYWLFFSSPGTAKLEGTVVYDGQPIPVGSVAFFCQGGKREVHTCRIKDGTYEISAVPAGTVKIAVLSFDPTRQAANVDSGKPITGKFLAIPKHFGDPDESGVTAVLRPGEQTLNIELSSKP